MDALRYLATVSTCVGLLVLFGLPAAAQDVRTGVEQLASQITKGAAEGRQLRVAVADFPDLQGVTCDIGRYIASRLTTRLTQTPRFFVIERQRLGQVLAELKFSMSDLVDPGKAKQLGRMAGVEAIVVGTVSDLGNQVDLDARLIEIETNRMLLGTSTTISKDQVVADMLKRGCQEVPTRPGSVQLPAPGPSQPSLGRYAHRFFAFDLTNVEVVDDEVKLTLMYTNRTDSPQSGGISGNLHQTYLVDNLGNRYAYTGDSFGRDRKFPPQVPEQISITFGKLRPGASSVTLALHWNFTHPGYMASDNVLIRGIVLRR